MRATITPLGREIAEQSILGPWDRRLMDEPVSAKITSGVMMLAESSAISLDGQFDLGHWMRVGSTPFTASQTERAVHHADFRPTRLA